MPSGRTKCGIVVTQDVTYPEVRGLRKGAAAFQDIGSRAEESTFRGSSVFSFDGSGITLAALSATGVLVSPILQNPLGSGVIASILDISEDFDGTVFTPGTAGIVDTVLVASTANVIQNPLLVHTINSPNLIGSGNISQCFPFPIANPGNLLSISAWNAQFFAVRPLASFWIGNTTNTGRKINVLKDDLGGLVILRPGTMIGIATVTATATNFINNMGLSLTWEEIPWNGT